MGRRCKGEWETLRGLVRWRALCFEARTESPNQIEKQFTPDGRIRGKNRGTRNGKWRGYPKGRLWGHKLHQKICAKFPIVARVDAWPLWAVLRIPSPSPVELTKIIAAIQPGLARQLSVEPNEALPWSRAYRLANPATIDALWRRGDLRALAALLALARYAEHTNDEELHAEAAWAAMHVFFQVAAPPILYIDRHRIFRFLREQFFSRVYEGGLRLPVPADIDKNIHELLDVHFAIGTMVLEQGRSIDYGRISYWSFQLGLTAIRTEAFGVIERHLKGKPRGRVPCALVKLNTLLQMSEREIPRRPLGVLQMLQRGRHPLSWARYNAKAKGMHSRR